MSIIKDFYNNIYDGKRGTNIHSYRIKKVINIINKLAPHKLLSVGCAKGEVEDHIDCFCIHGIDISDKNREYAINNCDKVYDYDLNSPLPLYDEYYDCIWCGEVIEHIFNTDLFINEMYRLLKKNGHLVLTTPNVSAWHERIASFLGWTPICSQCSITVNGTWFKKPIQPTYGHISLFNTIAIKKILFNVHFVKIKIYPSTDFKNKLLAIIDLIIAKFIHYSLSSNMIVVAKK